MSTFHLQPTSSTGETFSILPPGVSIPVGLDSSHEPVYLPVNGQNYLVAGDWNSNKTALLHALVLNGCASHSPRELSFRLADCKQGGFELEEYKTAPIPHIECVRTGVTPRQLLDFFKEAYAIVEDRYERLTEARVRHTDRYIRNIDEYNIVAAEVDGLEPMGRLLILVNEVQQAILNCADEYTATPDPAYAVTAQELTKLIVKVARTGSWAGVCTVLLADGWQIGNQYRLLRDYAPYCADRILFRTTDPDILRALLADIRGNLCTDELYTAVPALPDSHCLYPRDFHPPLRIQVADLTPKERLKALERIRETYPFERKGG